MQKVIDWLTKTKADLEAFDNKVQDKVAEYGTKQAKKAFYAGAIAGAVAMLAVLLVIG